MRQLVDDGWKIEQLFLTMEYKRSWIVKTKFHIRDVNDRLLQALLWETLTYDWVPLCSCSS